MNSACMAIVVAVLSLGLVPLYGCRSGNDSGGDPGASDSGLDDASVTACQAAVDVVRANCASRNPTESRLCFYDAVRPLCATGRTAFIQRMFACLMGQDCPAPSDPSGSSACVNALVESSATEADRTTGVAICACSPAALGCDAGLPVDSMADLMLLSPGNVMNIGSCLTSSGCDAGNACMMASGLAPALACP